MSNLRHFTPFSAARYGYRRKKYSKHVILQKASQFAERPQWRRIVYIIVQKYESSATAWTWAFGDRLLLRRRHIVPKRPLICLIGVVKLCALSP